MNEQTRATAMTAPEDAWDRLAALAFGDTASAGGCSVHTHDCTCLAEEHASVGVEPTQPSEASTHDAAAPGLPPPPPDPERPVDPEAEYVITRPDPVLPDAERPVYLESEPERELEPTPLWMPGPERPAAAE